MLLGMSTGEAIASSILAKNCFWASNPVPVFRILDRVWACAPRIAQTYLRIVSLRRSTPACVKPSDLSRTNVVQAPEISRLWRMASFGWKKGPCATCACLYAPDGVMRVLQTPRPWHPGSTFCRQSCSGGTANSAQSRLYALESYAFSYHE